MNLFSLKSIDLALAELESTEGLPDFDSLADEIGKALQNAFPHYPKNVRRMWEKRLENARRGHHLELKTIREKSTKLAKSISDAKESASKIDVDDLIFDWSVDFQDVSRRENGQDVQNANGATTVPSSLFQCPICGSWNEKKDTFDCRECNREHLCRRHLDENTNVCTKCAAKAKHHEQTNHEAAAEREHQKTTDQMREVALGKTKDESKNAPLAHGISPGEKSPRHGVSAAVAQKLWNKNAADTWYKRALAFKNGVGVPKNDVEAANCFRKSAQFGNADAQFELGCMYGKGQGVPMDAVEMAKLFFNAAVQGHVAAQYMLGWCYENACGVRLDLQEAKNWYRRAAQNGHELAKADLQRLSSGC